MRIALVSETYLPEINGVAMTLSRLVAGLQDAGHAVQLIRPKQGVDDGAGDEVNAEETLILVSGSGLPGYDSLRFGFPSYRRLRRAWKQFTPDYVHIATEGPLGWGALFAARALGIPVISSYHTNFNSYAQHYGFGFLKPCAEAYLRAFHNRTLATFVPTSVLQNELTQQGMKGVRVMSRGVDTDLYHPESRCDTLRAEWGASGAIAVLYVGRLAAEKNLDLAIRGYFEIQAECPNAQFVLVGDGPLREALMKQYPNFIFAGFKRGHELAQCYASADVFLFPSETETFGNVLTEAMASGLACVAYDYAAAKEYATNSVDAYLAPLGEEAVFLELSRALAIDVELRMRLRTNARQLMRSLNWTCVVNAYIEEVSALLRDTGELLAKPISI